MKKRASLKHTDDLIYIAQLNQQIQKLILFSSTLTYGNVLLRNVSFCDISYLQSLTLVER